MAEFKRLGFTKAQNEPLLRLGQYIFAFSHLDMAVMLGLVDRLGGNPGATLVTLRGWIFVFAMSAFLRLPRGSINQNMINDFRARLKTEYAFRNDVSHAQIGIEHGGETYLNSFGQGFGQAMHTQDKITPETFEENTQRCWALFWEMSETFNPQRHRAYAATLVDKKDLE